MSRFEFIVPLEQMALVKEHLRGVRFYPYDRESYLGVVVTDKATFDSFADYAARELGWEI